MSDRIISIEAIELATSEAIVEVLRRYGIQVNGHALNAADQTASACRAQSPSTAYYRKLYC